MGHRNQMPMQQMVPMDMSGNMNPPQWQQQMMNYNDSQSMFMQMMMAANANMIP
jgi:hypothetical protein